MKGTVCFEKRSRPFEGEVGANDIDDIGRLDDLLNGFFRNSPHGRMVNAEGAFVKKGKEETFLRRGSD